MKQLVQSIIFLALVGFVVRPLFYNKKGSEAINIDLLNEVSGGGWYFVAMQYYFGILNRSFVVFVTKDMICGARCRGALGSPGQIGDRWHDPLFYVRTTIMNKYRGIDVRSGDFKSIDNANFQIDKNQIKKIECSAKPKWGMGSVPYSGRIFLAFQSGRELELILLGTQDMTGILEHLKSDGFDPDTN